MSKHLQIFSQLVNAFYPTRSIYVTIINKVRKEYVGNIKIRDFKKWLIIQFLFIKLYIIKDNIIIYTLCKILLFSGSILRGKYYHIFDKKLTSF